MEADGTGDPSLENETSGTPRSLATLPWPRQQIGKRAFLPKNLVIVESPAKAKTIERYMGKDYRVLASMGHVRDLPKSD
ncbi:MAG: hypothetical protein H0V97_07305, partial [Actinobacteria bacterium]|nr:hypothetical protein [Actinomycetota bacterium]